MTASLPYRCTKFGTSDISSYGFIKLGPYLVRIPEGSSNLVESEILCDELDQLLAEESAFFVVATEKIISSNL